MKKILLPVFIISSFIANAQFWTEKATGFTTPAKTLNSISIVDANVIWANEYDNVALNYRLKTFTKSTDGGNTWVPGTINLGTNTADLGISSITAASATTAWVSAYPDNTPTSELGGIWKTIDSGVTWTKQTTALFSDPASYTDFVYFWDANNGVAVGDAVGNYFEIYNTSDGGTTWNTAASPIATGEFSYFNRYTVSGNSVWFGTSAGRIFKSVDKGLNWTVSTAPVGTNFTLDRFTFSNATKGLLINYSNTTTLYQTTDGGTTWNPIVTSGFYNTDIAYIPGTSTVISAASANPLGSSYSLDDGVTWTTIDSSVSHGTLAFLNNSFGFSAGLNTSATVGGIYKFSGIPLKVPTFDPKNHISAYPNPTNGILHINSESSLFKEVSVFDLLGRQIYSSKFSDLNKANLDLNSLLTGAYMLKITSDTGKTETIKIMKN